MLDNSDNILPKGSLILVTGATGYIGANVVLEALAAGYRVRGVARTAEKANKSKDIFSSPHYEAVVVAHMDVDGAFDEAVKGVDAIIHVASPVSWSPDPNQVILPAIKGVTSILNSALQESQIKRFVFTSSSAAMTSYKPNQKFHLDQNSWNTDVEHAIDLQPPYKAENALIVYQCSKTKAERALWEFVQEKKPHFVVNTVNPNYNMGRIVGSPSSTGAIILGVWQGNIMWEFPFEYMIDVVDVARLHLTAAVDQTVNNERIVAFNCPFNWNDVLDVFRCIKPEGTFAENRPGLDQNLSTVDNQLGKDLLKKWYGQEGYVSMEESLRANLAGVL